MSQQHLPWASSMWPPTPPQGVWLIAPSPWLWVDPWLRWPMTMAEWPFASCLLEPAAVWEVWLPWGWQRMCPTERKKSQGEKDVPDVTWKSHAGRGFSSPASWLQPSSWIPNNWIMKKLMVVLICSVSRVVGNPAIQNQTVLYSPSRFLCLEALLIMLNWEKHKLFQPGWSGVWILTQPPISCAFR